MVTSAPIANELTIFSCVLDPGAAPSGLHVHCGRHTEFEDVVYEDGSSGQEIVLPIQRPGNAWRAALDGDAVTGRGQDATGRGAGRGRGIAKKSRGQRK